MEEQNKNKETLREVIEEGKIKIQVNQTDGFIKTNFANNHNNHLNNSIRFADTKAGALVAANGLIAKFVFDAAQDLPTIPMILLAIGFMLLIAGIVLAILVVFPQKLHSKEKGILYWENVVNYDLDEYVETIETMDAATLRKNAIANNYIQAKILTKKFSILRYSFMSSLLGYSLLIAVALTVFIMKVLF